MSGWAQSPDQYPWIPTKNCKYNGFSMRSPGDSVSASASSMSNTEANMIRVAARCLVGAIFTFLIVGFFPRATWAQDTTLSGTVTDTTDAVLPGVNVTAV